MDAPNQNLRYVVFQYDSYYPSGAEHDCRGFYPTFEAANEACVNDRSYNCTDVLDTWTGDWY